MTRGTSSAYHEGYEIYRQVSELIAAGKLELAVNRVEEALRHFDVVPGRIPELDQVLAAFKNGEQPLESVYETGLKRFVMSVEDEREPHIQNALLTAMFELARTVGLEPVAQVPLRRLTSERRGAQLGGRAKAKKHLAEAKALQRQANDIWARHPGLSATAVARQLARAQGGVPRIRWTFSF